MLNWLEKLRNEPESYRKKLTLLVSASVTGTIFLAWLLYVTSGSLMYSSGASVATDDSSSPVATLKNLTAQVVDSVNQFTKTFDQLKSAINFSSSTDYVKGENQ